MHNRYASLNSLLICMYNYDMHNYMYNIILKYIVITHNINMHKTTNGQDEIFNIDDKYR